MRLATDRNADSCPFSIENTDSSNQLQLNTDNTGTLLQVVSGFQVQPLINLVVGEWYFIALTSDGVAPKGYAALASDSSLTTATLNSFASIVQTKFLVGTSEGAGNKFIDGSLTALRIWDAVLTQAELEQERRSIRPIRMANLNSFFPMLNANERLVDYSGLGGDLFEPAAGSWSTEDGPPAFWRRGRERMIVREVVNQTVSLPYRFRYP